MRCRSIWRIEIIFADIGRAKMCAMKNKKKLLLVFIHGFKGTDHTFHTFPADLTALISHTLPDLNIIWYQYPRYETRGDLGDTVGRFRIWLEAKVMDLEMDGKEEGGISGLSGEERVRVILVGHSMGGIVAAEAALSIVKDGEAQRGRSWQDENKNATTSHEWRKRHENATINAEEEDNNYNNTSTASSSPESGTATSMFPYIQAILAFDTPFLGISPGVLAHGAEEHINQASAAYKAFDAANRFFGGNSPSSTTPVPVANPATTGLPAADGSTASTGGWSKWGKVAAYGGAAAAIAGAAGAAYLTRNQISQGFAWAGSHLEFVGCLGRGAELQKRVEKLVRLQRTHGVGFANFYGCLSEKVSKQTQYAGSVLGQDRTFCIIPRSSRTGVSHTGNKRTAPRNEDPPPKRRRSSKEEAEAQAAIREEMKRGEELKDFSDDLTKSKGQWVKCVNDAAEDELRAHTSMFAPNQNPDYYAMVPRARDWVLEVVDKTWINGAEQEGGSRSVGGGQTEDRDENAKEGSSAEDVTT